LLKHHKTGIIKKGIMVSTAVRVEDSWEERMPFIELPDGNGKLYVPEDTPPAMKKHPCPDCAVCQQCSNERCEMCLKQKGLRCFAPPRVAQGTC